MLKSTLITIRPIFLVLGGYNVAFHHPLGSAGYPCNHLDHVAVPA